MPYQLVNSLAMLWSGGIKKPEKAPGMKILVTSDNHLGYKERDPVLSMDSFNTFEEVLCLANIKGVDLILQGGDLFHDNRPSRFTLVQAITQIKKYTFGSRDLTLRCNKKLNYEDPDLNIAIPIVAIHGNHDDPTGIFTTSALNILASSNLINYLGQCPNIDFVEIEPVILNEEVALYLLGNIRDRRLYRNFLQKKVNFMKPSGVYYNVLVVHQNRVPYGVKDYLPYEFIPEWFDLVIYGHEHESLVLNLKDFILLQPGSTVRTSLAENESYDKFVYVFDSATKAIERICLRTVRPFLIQHVDLDVPNVESVLKQKVEAMLKLLEGEERVKRTRVSSEGVSLYERRIDELVEGMSMLPLVRIKGKLRDQNTVNNHKFGLEFKDRIANSTDILKLVRERKARELKRNVVVEKVEILGIFRSYLNLKALSEEKLTNALGEFILKDDKNGFVSFFTASVEHMVERLKGCAMDDIDRRIVEIKNEVNMAEEIAGNMSEIDNKGAFTDML